jgi:hypothetical protein
VPCVMAGWTGSKKRPTEDFLKKFSLTVELAMGAALGIGERDKTPTGD